MFQLFITGRKGEFMKGIRTRILSPLQPKNFYLRQKNQCSCHSSSTKCSFLQTLATYSHQDPNILFSDLNLCFLRVKDCLASIQNNNGSSLSQFSATLVFTHSTSSYNSGSLGHTKISPYGKGYKTMRGHKNGDRVYKSLSYTD